MLKYCVQAMNIMANTSDGLTRAVRFGNDGEIDINDFVYVQEIQAGDRFDDEPPAPPEYLAAAQLFFSAWREPDTPEGAELRRQARAAYDHLATRDAALWAQLFPPQPPPPEYLTDFPEMLAALRQHPDGGIFFKVGAYGRCNNFYLNPTLTPVSSPIAEYSAGSEDDTRAALALLDETARTDPAGFWAVQDVTLFVFDAKAKARDVPRFALPLYEKRLDYQRRLLREEIKQGPRAFGFRPLDGYK